MTTEQAGDVLLVAIVEMAGGATEAGQRYEDFVLELLARHGGALERRTRTGDGATEVHLIRFRDQAGYASFLADPDRQDYRERIGAAAPTTRAFEVCDVR